MSKSREDIHNLQVLMWKDNVTQQCIQSSTLRKEEVLPCMSHMPHLQEPRIYQDLYS